MILNILELFPPKPISYEEFSRLKKTQIRIMRFLLEHPSHTADIARLCFPGCSFKNALAKASYHLNILKNLGVVNYTEGYRGSKTYYVIRTEFTISLEEAH